MSLHRHTGGKDHPHSPDAEAIHGRAERQPGQSFAMAASTRAGVMGSRSTWTPVASKIAFATTAPMLMMAGSPPPFGASSSLATNTVSIVGTQENRGRAEGA